MFELMFYGHVMCVAIARKRRNIYLVGSEKLTRLKIAADILMTFAGFYRRNKRHRLAIMLFKLKSVLNPPDASAITKEDKYLNSFWLLLPMNIV